MTVPSITRTHYEICRYSGGALVGFPVPCATLKEAEEEAAYMGRGNMINEKGDREPGIPVFELDDDEAQEQDGLYIRRVTTRTEASVF